MKILITLVIILITISISGQSKPEKKIIDNSPKAKLFKELEELNFSGGDYIGYSKYITDYLSTWHNIKSSKNYPYRYRRRRRESIDPIDLFSGGIAIRESLQLDTIMGDNKKFGKRVLVSTLKGPKIKSHPFKKMLGNREYKMSELAKIAPKDFYYIHINSFTNGLNIWDDLMIKLKSFYKRFETASIDYRIKDKMMTQLALKENKLLRGFYDSIVKEAIIVGSDPFILSGSDLTIVFKTKQSFLFPATVKNYRIYFKKKYKTKTKNIKIGKYNVNYLYSINAKGLSDRKINSYFVELKNNLFILSNSKGALQKVLKTYDNKSLSLAEAYEYKYMRSIYKLDLSEDFFIYMSDSFVRNIVSAELRLKESNRINQQFALTKMQNLLFLYHSLYKKYPKSIHEMITKLQPEKEAIDAKKKNDEYQNRWKTRRNSRSILKNNFKKIKKRMKGSEHYRYFMKLSKGLKLSKDKRSFESIKYGKIGYFIPNIDTKLKYVSASEAERYRNFIKNYNNYWKDFFDPIGIKISTRDKKIKINTHILPLINSSLYNEVAKVIGGKATTLEYRKLSNEWLKISFKISDATKLFTPRFYKGLLRELDIEREYIDLSKILGDNITFSIMDSSPLVDFNTKRLFTDMLSRGRFESMGMVSFLVTSLAHPIRVTFPIKKDAKLLEDEINFFISYFIKHPITRDFNWSIYKKSYKKQQYHVFTLKFWDMLTFRFYFMFTKDSLELTTTERYIKNIIDNFDTPKIVIKEKRNILFSFHPDSINLEKEFFDNMLIDNLIGNNLKNIRTLKLVKSLFGKELTQKEFYNMFGFQINNPFNEKYIYKDNKITHPTLSGYESNLIDNDKIQEEVLDKYYEIKTFQLGFEFTDTGIDTGIIIE